MSVITTRDKYVYIVPGDTQHDKSKYILKPNSDIVESTQPINKVTAVMIIIIISYISLTLLLKTYKALTTRTHPHPIVYFYTAVNHSIPSESQQEMSNTT
jgi:hypothetical protein